MIPRIEYIDKLLAWKDENVIKVITGIRRSGKSTLMKLFQEYLLENNVDASQIISINFEDLDYEYLLDYQELYNYLKNNMMSNQKYYIFLDEIQKVNGFEKVVDSLYVKENIDIYLTGSNAYMLSSELATLLAGRYVEIKMLPLSFQEYRRTSEEDVSKSFAEYLKNGGMPLVASMDKKSGKANSYLEGIYNTVIVKDIEDRDRRKNTDYRKITDISLLKTILKYLSSVIGSPVSMRKIADYLVSNGRKISANTVSDYVDALVESFILYPVEQFDVIGKKILNASKKFYIVDMGIRNLILPRKDYDFGATIENIVYLELLRRGNQIFVGRLKDVEIDFITEKDGIYTYIQVCADLTNEKTFEREIRPLRLITDNYPKVILTMDYNTLGNYDGIEVIHLLDWLQK